MPVGSRLVKIHDQFLRDFSVISVELFCAKSHFSRVEMAWDAGAEPDQGYRSGGASVGVLELAACVVSTLQRVTRLPSSRRGTQGLQHKADI